MRFLFIPFVFCCSICWGQSSDSIPVGKAFAIITNAIDIHGEWIRFESDSTCVHTYGSLVWGTESDTLGCTINQNQITIEGAAENTILSNLECLKVVLVNQKKYAKKVKKYSYRQKHFLYNRFLYPETIVGKDKLIITLKIVE